MRKTDPAKIQAAENQAKAVNMRRAGARVKEIGAVLGVCDSTVYSYISTYINEAKRQAADAMEDVVFLELERLDAMFMTFYSRALKGDKEAFHCCIQAQKMRADYLGLFAARKVEHSGTVLTITEMDREIARLLDELGTPAETVVARTVEGEGGRGASRPE